MHVLRNASDAFPRNSTVAIEIGRDEKQQPFLKIRDHGAGIPEKIKKRLFETTVSTKPGGTGMGLILVKQILKEHQGEIQIESREGEGTLVTFCFPLHWRERGQHRE